MKSYGLSNRFLFNEQLGDIDLLISVTDKFESCRKELKADIYSIIFL